MAKLTDAEGEAAETQVWLEFSVRNGYVERNEGATLYKVYEEIIATFVGMINHADTWIIASKD